MANGPALGPCVNAGAAAGAGAGSWLGSEVGASGAGSVSGTDMASGPSDPVSILWAGVEAPGDRAGASPGPRWPIVKQMGP